MTELDLSEPRRPGALSRRTLLTGLLAGAGGSALTVIPALPARAAVTYQFQSQQQGNWCSPACARIALTARGRTATQYQLAKELGVGVDGATHGLPDISNLPRVLNARLGTGYYGVRYSSQTQSAYNTAVDADIRYNIDRGYAVLLNTWRYTRGSEVIATSSGHYLTVVGYDSTRYYLADPASYLNDPGRWWSKSTVWSWQKNYRWVAATNVGTTPTGSWPTVQAGSSGYRVTVIQYELRHRGYAITVDGSFGSQTDSVVRSFQSSQGLTVDGVVGPQTWPRLIISVQLGSSGDAVRAAQTALTANGYALTADGNFGSVTDSKAKAFQQAHGLTVDGVVGAQTWAALV